MIEYIIQSGVISLAQRLCAFRVKLKWCPGIGNMNSLVDYNNSDPVSIVNGRSINISHHYLEITCEQRVREMLRKWKK